MKHIATRLMVALFIVIGFIPVLVACGSESEADPVCMGIVIGNRSNSEGVIGPMVAPLMPDPLPVGSVVVATEVSGSPAGDPVFTGTVTELENSYDQKDLQMNIRNGAIAAISSSAASSPQADTLGAIESTADKLKTSGLMGCEIHVYDSGLSTAGLIEFQQDLLARDPQTVIGQIPAADTLDGMTIIFENLGRVYAPQPSLDASAKEHLATIWAGVITARGGTMLSPDSLSTNGTAPAEGLPEVDVVPVPQETIDFGDLEPTCTPAATSWVMPADALFDPYSAVLKDEAKAMLDQAIVEIQENSEITGIEVTGHTASIGIEPSGMELSQKRADAVTNYLANGGIDRSLITAQGVGDAQPACEDWDPVNGVQINPCASSERNVSLTVTGVILCDN